MPCLVQSQQVVGMVRQLCQAAARKPFVMLDEALQARIVHQVSSLLLARLVRQFLLLLAAPFENAVKGRRLQHNPLVDPVVKGQEKLTEAIVHLCTPNRLWIFVSFQRIDRVGQASLAFRGGAETPAFKQHNMHRRTSPVPVSGWLALIGTFVEAGYCSSPDILRMQQLVKSGLQ